MSEQNKTMSISARSFLSTLAIIGALMCATFIGANMVPGCSLPVWKLPLAPVLVLGQQGSASILMIIAFLFVLGGAYRVLEQAEILGG